MKCPICGSEESEKVDLVAYEGLQWKRCLSCGVGFQFPYASELSHADPSLAETYDRYLDLQ